MDGKGRIRNSDRFIKIAVNNEKKRSAGIPSEKPDRPGIGGKMQGIERKAEVRREEE